MHQLPCHVQMQAGEAPTEDVEKDWQRSERERSQLWDMKRQVGHNACCGFGTAA